MRFWLDRGLDGFRVRRRAVPVRARGHQLREPAGDARDPARSSGASSTASTAATRPAGRGQPVAGGRAPLLRRRRRVPHGLPLPAHAAPVHGASAARTAGRSSRSSPHTPPIPPGCQWGLVPAQPRRADAGDGDRRGARLHVLRVRQGPADAAQPGHPPPPGPADGQRPAPDRAAERLLLTLPGSPILYYGDEIGMGDNVYLATATACARPCSGRRPQRRLLHAPSRPSSTCRSSPTPSTATRP